MEQIRTRDDQGNLIAAGFMWTEEHEAWKLFLALAGVLALLSLPGLLDYFSGRGPLVLGAIPAALAALSLYACHRYANHTSALIFHLDGHVEAPFGMPRHRRVRRFKGNHGYTTSIETNRHNQVLLYSRGGDIAVLANLRKSNDAHKVAVQLNQALEDIREAGAEYGKGPFHEFEKQ